MRRVVAAPAPAIPTAGAHLFQSIYCKFLHCRWCKWCLVIDLWQSGAYSSYFLHFLQHKCPGWASSTTTSLWLLAPCGSLSIRDVFPLELFACLWLVSPQVQGSVSSATLLLLYVNYSCIQADTLKMHMVMHSGEKSFKCKQCNNSCTNAGGLKRHILVHTGEKPFSCNQCKYSCAVAGSMKMHMLVHTGERPFKC